ncbi:DNA primase [Parabacteroides sp. 52]|uniref:DNA primase n=1 Tax=unclassified Parabacteroides TaxID=2649774 RepID=UPI0013D10378|nr:MULTISPECIES: DNA primase [unclassified Parabacteroides]MDH6533761.1 DNA primase [Parabacteroides sp. PM5-20]NDV54511.1 DNA primase [Parabacteroides sp. 52]
MIDQPTIDRILDAANIVDVVSEFVTLRRRGVNYVGLCPFHTDKTPSFYVSPAKNICKCFACGEGGTAVHFIMKHEQMTYFDALRYLGKKYNIDIQERELTDREKQIRSDRESMLIVNTWAQQYFSTQLYEQEEGKNIGLRYFRERGFREDIIRKFQLGYSLDKRDALYLEATKSGYQKEFLEKTGLIIAYDNGNVNDRFRGRVMFPVHTLSGKVVAFGGRTLKKDEKTAKYVNSPESEIYHKSNELYGIFFAKQPIVKADRCYLVEGYTDVISMHQAGIENVVASSGTALTQGQIRLIRRFTNNITVLYDGDAAGIKAAIRGIDMLLEEGMNIKVVLLPDGEDPDSYARKHNATGFNEFIQKSETDFIRFKTKLLLEDAGNDPIKRSSLINDIIRSVAIIPDTIARTVYIRECSSMLEVDERVLLNEVNKIRLQNEEKRTAQTASPTAPLPPPIPAGYVDYPAYNPQDGNIPDMPGADAPPPPPEDLPQEETGYAPQPPQTEPTMPPPSPKRSPFEVYELALLRYIVRYGEFELYKYKDEESGEEVRTLVIEYIHNELAQDDLTFQTPLFKEMLDEAVSHYTEEGFVANRFFLHHPNPAISKLAANLMSDKYQLSKYHFKFRVLEQEEDKLQQLVLKDIFALKDAFINHRIKDLHTQIKDAQYTKDMDRILALMQELTQLNKIKYHLSKELGERIILKI